MPQKKDVCETVCFHKDAIEAAEKSVLDAGLTSSLADFFRILGDPTRVRMLTALAASEMCVCDLSAFMRMNQSAISHQLRTLKDAHFVTYRRDGKIAYYSLADEHITQILDLGITHLSEKGGAQ